jgi:hypothetical protein
MMVAAATPTSHCHTSESWPASRNRLTTAITGRPPVKPIWGRPWFGGEGRILGAIEAGYGLVIAAQALLSYMQESLGYDAVRGVLELALAGCLFALSAVLVVVAIRHGLHSGEPPSQGPTQATS